MLALVATIVIFVGITGKKVPLLTNLRADIALLVFLGMAIYHPANCARVMATLLI